MRTDLYASEPQYLDHLVPIWLALEPAERGRVTVPRTLVAHAQHRGVPISAISQGRPRRGGGPVLVASHQDYRAVGARPTVYVEHGAGQSYTGDPASESHPSFSGGRARDNVALFIVPNETVAAKNRDRYPEIPNAVVGDAPKLDPWRNRETPPWRSGDRVGPMIAISFHADLRRLVPEFRSALPHYDPGLPALVEHAEQEGWTLLGHGHPRIFRSLERRWRALGITPVADFDQVLAAADVYVADNTSTLYEFASTGRPVVVMNAPWYRRDVSHGLRFWDYASVGIQVEDPDGLPNVIGHALADHPAIKGERDRIVDAVYPRRDGRSAERAAEAIRATIGELETVEEEGRPMADPYAPKRSRRTETVVFPAGRLRRLGATDTEIAEWRAEFDALPVGEQRTSVDQFALLTDEQVREEIEGARSQAEERRAAEDTGKGEGGDSEDSRGDAGQDPGDGGTPDEPSPEDPDEFTLRDDDGEIVATTDFVAHADVPKGNIDSVLEWVGDDPTRAEAALAVEEDGKDRTTLKAALEEIIAADRT